MVVPLTDVTPPALVVVAITLPVGSTASIVPAGVASDVSQIVEVAVNSEVLALVKFCVAVHQ